MLSLREFWRRHKQKIFVSAGVLGSGYFLYRLYDGHRQRLEALEKEVADQRENDELVKAQIQAHFESIQRISDTLTLPHAMLNLSNQVAEEMDLSQLLEKLFKGKGQPNTLTSSEKLDLWDRLKILSFTRMALSVWAMTALGLYIRVQVNILGRHLYVESARNLDSSDISEGNGVDKEDQQKFLGSAEYLSYYTLPALIADMEVSTKEVIKGKQLRDVTNAKVLHGTIMRILDSFMSMGSPYRWLNYMIPEDAKSYGTSTHSNDDGVAFSVTKYDQLMMETQDVLSSSEFRSVLEISLKMVVDRLVEYMETRFDRGGLTSGLPLAKVLPQVAQMCPLLLEEPNKNQFIQIIRNIPEVELFFTLLYSNMPSQELQSRNPLCSQSHIRFHHKGVRD